MLYLEVTKFEALLPDYEINYIKRTITFEFENGYHYSVTFKKFFTKAKMAIMSPGKFS